MQQTHILEESSISRCCWIPKSEYKERVDKLRELLPVALRSEVRFEAPFATNHQILARVRGGGERCWIVQEALQASIDADGFQVRGKALKVTVSERKRINKSKVSTEKALRNCRFP